MAGRVVKQERAIRTRATLIRAAAEVFAESGFAGASVSNIARRAGLTLGAMYFHFQNKEELAREIVLSQPATVVPPLESRGLQHAVDITLTWAYGMLDNPVLLAGARLVTDQEQFVSPRDNSHAQWTEIITQDFLEARRLRELRSGAEVAPMARLIVNACTGAQMHASLESGRRDLPQRVEETWRCVLPSLAVPSTAKRLEFGEARGRGL
ncbi:ScbR family autoregulator-binding transcription factor [Streptomyces sp. NPDC059740]|uniref:ScbR family autoregulator-binding transcription factor n=1 Tax=Streptomyces sp. NPDC059740 TaxID=3346926 RepID=UPI00365D95FC